MVKFAIIAVNDSEGSDYFFKGIRDDGQSVWVGALRDDFKRFTTKEEAENQMDKIHPLTARRLQVVAVGD